MNKEIRLIECPRDAMQGFARWIPTKEKIRYINAILKVGFHTVDFGSFVSEKAIPQMKDTAEVLRNLDLSSTASSLLAIVANVRGAQEAAAFEEISYLGFPFSVSETFQRRNTNSTIDESLLRVLEIRDICEKAGKKLVVYISMGFGNPYGDPWSPEIVTGWCKKLHHDGGIDILALSDTVGKAEPGVIESLFTTLIPELPGAELGAHFHTLPNKWMEKIVSAHKAGCYRFDGALGGYGGCPMAEDKLTGNMPMENLVGYFGDQKGVSELDIQALNEAIRLARQIFAS